MANYGNARSNEKDLLVEVRWIRPTKLCAIFDLFLAILAYIIALVAGKWVFDCKGWWGEMNKQISAELNQNKHL